MHTNSLQLLETIVLWLAYSATIIAFLYCSYTDLSTRRIPNRVTVPMMCIGFVTTAILQDWATALLGGLLAGGVLFIPYLIAGPNKAGMGDVKLAILGGLLVGPSLALTGLFIMVLAAIVVLTPLLLLRKIQMRQTVPFGPFIAIGFLTILVPSWLTLSIDIKREWDVSMELARQLIEIDSYPKPLPALLNKVQPLP